MKQALQKDSEISIKSGDMMHVIYPALAISRLVRFFFSLRCMSFV
jgi:hypothetical protein